METSLTPTHFLRDPLSGHPRLGATLMDGGCFFAVWAPKAARLDIVFEGNSGPSEPVFMEPLDAGYFTAFIEGIREGARYFFRFPDGELSPDPTSRFQPAGADGPSQVVDHRAFAWSDESYQGVALAGQVIYELHTGAFSKEGTFTAIIPYLDRLKAMGVTVLELMPVAECRGTYNWGYDGLFLFAPSCHYGDYASLKRLVDAAHQHGLAVIVDAVYNHVGPGGEYLRRFSDDYFSTRYKNEWGEAINFDGDNADYVREFFLQNIVYWIREFHLDGVRLDATQSIFDSREYHILKQLTEWARRAAAPRFILVIGESEPQDVRLVKGATRGGFGMDAFWCDDFHHASHVALTGQKEAYYSDYTGTPQEFIDLFKYSALYQGQYYSWQKNNRGTPLERTPAESCVFFLQNHDQVANSLSGERVHRRTSPGLYRALSAILLLAPQTPLIFMGQETGDEAPFVFFGDYDRGLAPLVRDGRHDFLSQFPSYKTHRGRLPDPSDRSLWNAVKLKHAENPFITRLYHDLLRIRKEDVLIRKQDRFRIDGAVLSAHAFVIRFNGDGQGRLLVVNLDHDFAYAPLSTPLVAPGLGSQWKSLFSTEHPFYGGQGCFLRQEDEGWTIPARSATLLTNASGDI